MRAVALEVGPAYCNLGWVMFVHACEATIARTCREGLWLKGTGNRFSSESAVGWERTGGREPRARLVDVFLFAMRTL